MTILARVNTFGNIYRLTSFGESHGPGIGGVIDGCPAGIELDTAFIQSELNRRKPGQSKITTPRKEDDEVQFLSGIYEGKTTGTPIGFIIWNKNQHSADYDNMKNVYRPSHADYTYQTKYGIRDPRGGGRSSARETIARCVAGAIAKLVLRQKGIRIQAFTSQVGNIKLNGSYTDYDLDKAEDTAVRCPDPATAEKMEALIAEVKSKGDTIGGVITCVAQGVPIGLGEPVFGKLHAALGHAMLTINAVKGFEYGDGFEAALYRGSERNDRFFNDNGLHSTGSMVTAAFLRRKAAKVAGSPCTKLSLHSMCAALVTVKRKKCPASSLALLILMYGKVCCPEAASVSSKWSL